jgi:hypothetical protein
MGRLFSTSVGPAVREILNGFWPQSPELLNLSLGHRDTRHKIYHPLLYVVHDLTCYLKIKLLSLG